MEKNYAAKAVEYYTLMGEKNVEELKKFLHPDVEFSSPLLTLKGKDATMQAMVPFMNAINSLTIRAQFGEKDQAMIVYEVDLPGVAKDFPSASWLTFRDGLIVKCELFFDGGKVLSKK